MAAHSAMALRLLLVLLASTAALVHSDVVCVRPVVNTLSSTCFGVCSDAPLCVSYAPETSSSWRSSSSAQDDATVGDDEQNDGLDAYYTEGCAFSGVATCHTNASGSCELQCLTNLPSANSSWVLEIAQPQSDQVAWSLFQHLDAIAWPSTLTSLSLLGLSDSRRVPLSFSHDAFTNSSAMSNLYVIPLRSSFGALFGSWADRNCLGSLPTSRSTTSRTCRCPARYKACRKTTSTITRTLDYDKLTVSSLCSTIQNATLMQFDLYEGNLLVDLETLCVWLASLQ